MSAEIQQLINDLDRLYDPSALITCPFAARVIDSWPTLSQFLHRAITNEKRFQAIERANSILVEGGLVHAGAFASVSKLANEILGEGNGKSERHWT